MYSKSQFQVQWEPEKSDYNKWMITLTEKTSFKVYCNIAKWSCSDWSQKPNDNEISNNSKWTQQYFC